MDNETIFAYKEKIAITENSIATVAAVITDNWSQSWDEAIINFFENSTNNGSSNINASPTATFTNSTFQNFFNAINSWDIFGDIPWLIWIIIAAGTSLIIAVFIIIISCLVLNKKRDDLRMMRQNSASNLDPYRRPPLPPVNHKDISGNDFQGSFLLSRHLETSKTMESHLSAVAEKTEHMSMLVDAQDGNGNNLFGINMTGIRGIPVMPVQSDERRPLPVPPPGCLNQL
ncbi:hypothetical protein X798_05412 [Onchocerca flexuosa]|uniref:Uncharacterized protein n=1 Tax=Onchocerca flexuosa TaxID=387005 RepID=A0A238BQG8_9BILA|nr:hypothetical protein X798_05412 [Onchocerca flexuosa]